MTAEYRKFLYVKCEIHYLLGFIASTFCMKRELLYERRQMALRMEARLVVVAGISVVAAIFALRAGWLPSVGFLILGALAFALSRVFNLLADLFASIHSSDESTNVASVKEQFSQPEPVVGSGR